MEMKLFQNNKKVYIFPLFPRVNIVFIESWHRKSVVCFLIVNNNWMLLTVSFCPAQQIAGVRQFIHMQVCVHTFKLLLDEAVTVAALWGWRVFKCLKILLAKNCFRPEFLLSQISLFYLNKRQLILILLCHFVDTYIHT